MPPDLDRAEQIAAARDADLAEFIPRLDELISDPAAELERLADDVSILETYDRLLGLEREDPRIG